MRPLPVVAIDGPAGVGKSTVAKGVASALSFAYVDTGALYRAVALLADDADISWDRGHDIGKIVPVHAFAFDSKGLLMVNGEPVEDRIRSPRISQGASVVAVHKEVREALLGMQRKLGEEGGVVLEGRDIGTSVFPDAEVKFFLTASPAVRAHRRYLQLEDQGVATTFDEVLAEQLRRDDNDRNRALSPLSQADDAVEIVSDHLSAADVITQMIRHIRASFPLTSK